MKQLVTKTEAKVKCDLRDCKNDASYCVFGKGRIGRFYLCKQCLDDIVANVVKSRTPKSPKNTIKKIIDEKEITINAEE